MFFVKKKRKKALKSVENENWTSKHLHEVERNNFRSQLIFNFNFNFYFYFYFYFSIWKQVIQRFSFYLQTKRIKLI